MLLLIHSLNYSKIQTYIPYGGMGGESMPIYEYKCSSCGHKFEELVKINEKKMPVCPKCGNTNVNKIVSSFKVTSGGCGSSNSGVGG